MHLYDGELCITEDGSYDIYGSFTGCINIMTRGDVALNLHDATISSQDGAAINAMTTTPVTINTYGTCNINAAYDNGGAITVEGNCELIFGGDGTLNITNTGEDGLCVDTYGSVDFQSGTYYLKSSDSTIVRCASLTSPDAEVTVVK